MALRSVLQGEWLDGGLKAWVEYDDVTLRVQRVYWTNTTGLAWSIVATRRSDGRRYSGTVGRDANGSVAIPQSGVARWDTSVDARGQLDVGIEVRSPPYRRR